MKVGIIITTYNNPSALGRVLEGLNLQTRLPDEITVDDIFSELYFKLQVNSGLRELDGGKGIPHKKVKECM